MYYSWKHVDLFVKACLDFWFVRSGLFTIVVVDLLVNFLDRTVTHLLFYVADGFKPFRPFKLILVYWWHETLDKIINIANNLFYKKFYHPLWLLVKQVSSLLDNLYPFY